MRIIGTFFLILVLANSIYAQGLSQLDFDKQIVKEKKKSQEDEILKGLEGAKKESLTEEYLTISPEEKELIDPSRLLVPLLKGPAVDADNQFSITTEKTWRKKEQFRCFVPDGEENLCKKTRALQELLKRYTGDDDFFKAQCLEKCPDAEQKPILSGVTLIRKVGYDFKFVAAGEQDCKFAFVREPDKDWVVQAVKDVKCVCISISCPVNK